MVMPDASIFLEKATRFEPRDGHSNHCNMCVSQTLHPPPSLPTPPTSAEMLFAKIQNVIGSANLEQFIFFLYQVRVWVTGFPYVRPGRAPYVYCTMNSKFKFDFK